MITLFSTPKPFTGRFAGIQNNTLRNWRSLSGKVQILVFDKSKEHAPVYGEVGAEVVSEFESNTAGLPYLDSMFNQAQKLAKFDFLCFANADILFGAELLKIPAMLASFPRFLIIGLRRDYDVRREIDFEDPAESHSFWKKAILHASAHSPSGMDYFIFKKGLWEQLPSLYPGRAGFDNWLVWKARRRRIPLVDASDFLKVIHQNHDYSHHPDGKKGVFEGEEALSNRSQLKAPWAVMNILDADCELTPDGVRKKQSEEYKRRYWGNLWRVYPEMAYPLIFFNKILWKFFVSKRLPPPREKT